MLELSPSSPSYSRVDKSASKAAEFEKTIKRFNGHRCWGWLDAGDIMKTGHTGPGVMALCYCRS